MQETIICAQNLTKRYGETIALSNVDFAVKKGEVFGIIGMSGAGKSTLVRCLTCLEMPTEGHVFLGEEDLTALSAKQLRAARKKMGMIFQHFNLFSSRTALENIIYPLEIDGVPAKQRYDRGIELLELVGLKAKQNHYPAQLSGGEKQRIAIARALARKPVVLFCDEATSALDPRTTHSILDLLTLLNQKLDLTIVFITHEMEVIKQACSHVAVLEHGEIVEQGMAIDLFSSPKHPTTKRFLQNLSHTLPEHFIPKAEDQELLRLFFKGSSTGEPIISRLIREHAVEINILLGGIDVLKSETVGNLVVALSGTANERSKARQFLEEQGVNWERIE